MATQDHREEIERLIRRREKDARTHTFARLADLYRKSGELEQALAVVQEGLKHHPHYLNARIVHARVLRELGRIPDARGAFERVLEIDSENLVAQTALAELGTARVLYAAEPRTAASGPASVAGPESAPPGREPASSRWLARLDADWRNGRQEDPPRLIPASPPDAARAEEQEEARPEDAAPGDRSPVEGEALAPAEKPEVAEPAGSGAPPPSDAAASAAELDTATLAALFVRQGLFDRAIAVYERLLARDPYNARLAGALEDARRKARARSGGSPSPGADPGGAAVEQERPRHESDPSDDQASPSGAAPTPTVPSEIPDRAPGRAGGAQGAPDPPATVRAGLRRILDGDWQAGESDDRESWAAWLARLDSRRD